MAKTFRNSCVLQVFLLALLFTSCGSGDQQSSGAVTDNEKPYLKVLDYRLEKDFPSASGVESSGGDLYVVGDDSYDLRKYNASWKLLISYPLMEQKTPGKRIPKAIKPDYESLCWLDAEETLLLLTGSGSDSPHRDFAVVMSMKNGRKLVERSMKELYDLAWSQAGQEGDRINIEGMLNTGKEIYMFHRGNLNENLTIRMEREAFFNYIMGKSNLIPDMKFASYELPGLNGFKAGMSGADYVKEENAIVFTASVEGTVDEVSDGEVLGSYIGWIDLKQPEKVAFCLPLKKNGQIIKTKQEGVSCIKAKQDIVHLVTVSDDDQGNSELFSLKLVL